MFSMFTSRPPVSLLPLMSRLVRAGRAGNLTRQRWKRSVLEKHVNIRISRIFGISGKGFEPVKACEVEVAQVQALQHLKLQSRCQALDGEHLRIQRQRLIKRQRKRQRHKDWYKDKDIKTDDVNTNTKTKTMIMTSISTWDSSCGADARPWMVQK